MMGLSSPAQAAASSASSSTLGRLSQRLAAGIDSEHQLLRRGPVLTVVKMDHHIGPHGLGRSRFAFDARSLSVAETPYQGRFPTTCWSRVAHAGDRADPEARSALESLCRDYWYPLYAFARGSGLAAEDAADAVQGTFATLLDRGGLAAADSTRGRFRTYLLAACRHHLADQRDRGLAKARRGPCPRPDQGGGRRGALRRRAS